MIEAVRIQNFLRVADSQKIRLDPVTILVGTNSSGKSSILKAIHWCVRCATLAERQQNNRLSITLERMDFAPSRDFRSLAFKSTLQGKSGGSNNPVTVSFTENFEESTIELKSLGNDAGVSVEFSGDIENKITENEMYTAYIPGLAGVGEFETILARPVLNRRAASGDGGSVLRQVMLMSSSELMNTGEEFVELSELQKWASKVFEGLRLWIKFNQKKDSNINASFFLPSMQYEGRGSNTATMRRPVEMAGTGLLQVIQIFSYLLAFRPKIMLIDEPDAHLHYSAQEKLIVALEQAAAEYPDTQFILTTHSPRMVKRASRSAGVVWMENGAVRESGRVARDRMGWTALDQELIIFSEDEDTEYLQELIDQFPEIRERIVIWPCFGTSGLPDGRRIRKLTESLNFKALAHRDRDFLNDDEIEKWKDTKGYKKENIMVFVTNGNDIEASFQHDAHIARALDVDSQLMEGVVQSAVDQLDQNKCESAFSEAYMEAQRSLRGQGNAIARYRELGGHCKATVKGKDLQQALRQEVRHRLTEAGLATKLARYSRIYKGNPDFPLSENLRQLCLKILDHD